MGIRNSEIYFPERPLPKVLNCNNPEVAIWLKPLGPCRKVMSGNFAPDSCTGEASCAVLATRMLSVCIDQKIPDVPRGLNPNAGYCLINLASIIWDCAGKRFTLARSKKMHAAFARAGCTMPHADKLKSTPAPTPLATGSPSAQVIRYYAQKHLT